MSYDFAIVLPSQLERLGLVAPLDDTKIASFYDRFTDSAGATPKPLATFVATLLERVPFGETDEISEDSWLMVTPGANPDMAQVASSFQSIPEALATILDLTFEQGLAVLDPQSRTLYDPTDSVWIQVTTDGGPASPYLSRSLLEQCVDLAVAKDGFVVIADPDEDYLYVQTRYTDGIFEVEHRGAEDQHYAAVTRDARLVTEVIWSWVTDGDEWRTALPWKKFVLE